LSFVAPLSGKAQVPKAVTKGLAPSSLLKSFPPHGGTNTQLQSSATAAAETSGGDATIPAEIFNLVKGIVGVGVLSLPAGIAAFANAQSAVVPTIALVSVIGMLSGYGFFLIGRVCALTKTKTFREAWAASVSPSTSWIPAVSVTCKTMCAVVAYSMVLTDTFGSLFAGFGITGFSSTSILLGLTSVVLLPLCLLKNLSSLAPFSLVGVMGMLYTAVAMAIRFFGTAYKKGGKFYNEIPANLQPSFGTVGAKGILNPSTAILIGMLSTAYMAHFNAPKFYTELKNNTIPRYCKVVSVSFAISIAIFASMACLGFCTFGAASSGLILNNYATQDKLMGLSRIAVATSLVFSYPLAFVGVREGVMDMFKLDSFRKSASKTNLLTVALLSLVTVLALIIPDVTFILSFAGATLGNALIYVYPALMFRGAVKKLEGTDAEKKNMNREVKLALASAVLGIGMGTLGAKMAIQSLR